MSKPKKQPKKKAKTTALAIKSETSLQWGGVMPKIQNDKDTAQLSTFCNQVGKIYGVPSLGVNVMGGNPYLNKDGRLFLLNDLREGKSGLKAIRKEFLQMSRNLDEAAIIKVTLVFRDGHEVEAIGEASKQSVKLDAVKQTLNMMAETRGLNRAIWQEIGGDVWKRVSANLNRSKLDDDTKQRIVQAGVVSYEEMQQPRASKAKPTASTPEELCAVIKQAVESAKTVDVIIDLDEKSQTSDKLTAPMKQEIHTLALNKVGLVENGGKQID